MCKVSKCYGWVIFLKPVFFALVSFDEFWDMMDKTALEFRGGIFLFHKCFSVG